ncbi:hypothetical protein ACMSFP_26650, partial [Bacteroides thetaiotaomicron]|uniref:hypothetical protein n=1 Tax=Bacteroides thetaiotaomicron TaxID=818 RepID=UPI0039C20954
SPCFVVGMAGKKEKKCVAMQCVSAVCIPMRYVYIARSVLVGHSCLSRFAQKDFKITFATWK